MWLPKGVINIDDGVVDKRRKEYNTFLQFSAMQSDRNSFCGDVVLNNVNIVFTDEDKDIRFIIKQCAFKNIM